MVSNLLDKMGPDIRLQWHPAVFVSAVSSTPEMAPQVISCVVRRCCVFFEKNWLPIQRKMLNASVPTPEAASQLMDVITSKVRGKRAHLMRGEPLHVSKSQRSFRYCLFVCTMECKVTLNVWRQSHSERFSVSFHSSITTESKGRHHQPV